MKIIVDSLSYAFRGSGKSMLLVGAVISLISYFASWAPVLGIFAYVFLSGYFCATFFTVVQSTAVGDSEAPEFPDVSNIMEDLLWPMLQVFLVALFSFSPWLVYSIFIGGADTLIADVLLVSGVIYFPMAILAVVVLGYIGALNPLIVIPGIFRAGWLYWLAVVLLYLIQLLEGLITAVVGGSLVLSLLMMALVGMYVLMTNARILGLVYKEREEELGWL